MEILLSPCFLERAFFEGVALQLPQAESLHLEGLDRPEKRAVLVQDVGSLMRVLEIPVTYTKENSSHEVELKKLRAKLVAVQKRRSDE